MPPRPKYLVLKNATEYQHYKERRPPWVKLHRRILDDRVLSQEKPYVRWLFLGLVLLTSEEQNRAILLTSASHKEIARRTSLTQYQVREGIKTLQTHGKVQFVNASTALAACRQSASPLRAEEQRTEDRETELPSGSSKGSPQEDRTADVDIPLERPKLRATIALDFYVAKLLPLLRDRDDGTEGVLRSFTDLTESSWAKVIESVQTQGPRYPTRYAVGALTLERKEQAA